MFSGDQRHGSLEGMRSSCGSRRDVGEEVVLRGMLFYRRSLMSIVGTSDIPTPLRPPRQGLRFEPLTSHQRPTFNCQRPYLSLANHSLAGSMPI